jgi:hypothetical protein
VRSSDYGKIPRLILSMQGLLEKDALARGV